MLSDKTHELIAKYKDVQQELLAIHASLLKSLEEDTDGKISLCGSPLTSPQLYKAEIGTAQDIEDLADKGTLKLKTHFEKDCNIYELTLDDMRFVVVLPDKEAEHE